MEQDYSCGEIHVCERFGLVFIHDSKEEGREACDDALSPGTSRIYADGPNTVPFSKLLELAELISSPSFDLILSLSRSARKQRVSTPYRDHRSNGKFPRNRRKLRRWVAWSCHSKSAQAQTDIAKIDGKNIESQFELPSSSQE